jgi:hypothetical protein
VGGWGGALGRWGIGRMSCIYREMYLHIYIHVGTRVTVRKQNRKFSYSI